MFILKFTLFTILFLSANSHAFPEEDFMHNFDNISLVECNQVTGKITKLERIKGERINLNMAHEEFTRMIFPKSGKKHPEKYKKCLVFDKVNTQKEYRMLIWVNGIEFVTQDYGKLSLNKLLSIRHQSVSSSSQPNKVADK